ncbi:MAG: CYTH domain-containing protein [archaeon]
MIELEKTFLAKKLPEGLKNCKHKEIIDIYIPKEAVHPCLRIRKNEDRYEITKKKPVKDDPSKQIEHTVPLAKEEFDSLMKLDGKKVRKIRYDYEYKGKKAEFDVFQGPLKGIVVVDCEFDSEEEKAAFKMPDFCLVEITHEQFIAGGMVCGKTYEDLEEDLKRYNYKKLFL